jgi:hypothetical protein
MLQMGNLSILIASTPMSSPFVLSNSSASDSISLLMIASFAIAAIKLLITLKLISLSVDCRSKGSTQDAIYFVLGAILLNVIRVF